MWQVGETQWLRLWQLERRSPCQRRVLLLLRQLQHQLQAVLVRR